MRQIIINQEVLTRLHLTVLQLRNVLELVTSASEIPEHLRLEVEERDIVNALELIDSYQILIASKILEVSE